MNEIINQRRVYLHAAKLIANHEETFSCNAVRTASHNFIMSSDPNVNLYQQIMGAPHKEWGADPDLYLLPTDIEKAARGRTFGKKPESRQRCRDFRVMLLCMMAACVKDMVETPDA